MKRASRGARLSLAGASLLFAGTPAAARADTVRVEDRSGLVRLLVTRPGPVTLTVRVRDPGPPPPLRRADGGSEEVAGVVNEGVVTYPLVREGAWVIEAEPGAIEEVAAPRAPGPDGPGRTR